MLQTTMQIVSAALSIYMLAIVVRVVMTWFGGASYGRPMEILARFTDPYLDFFRRLRFLRIGHIDFSPVVAIISLSILSNIALRVGYAARVSLGYILAILVSSLADAAGFFLVLLLILTGVRLIALFAGANTTNRFWMMLDNLLQPIAYGLVQKIIRSETNYRNALLFVAGFALLVLLLGQLAIGVLIRGLVLLPV